MAQFRSNHYRGEKNKTYSLIFRLVVIFLLFVGGIGFFFLLKNASTAEGVVFRSASNDVPTPASIKKTSFTGNFYLPELQKNQVLYTYPYFAFAFDTIRQLPAWAAYEISAEQICNTDSLIYQCPILENEVHFFLEKSFCGVAEVYANSLLIDPMNFSADREIAQSLCLQSLIIPQLRDFKTGIWQESQKNIRRWAGECRHLYVTLGAIWGHQPSEGDSQCVPEAFYMVILDYVDPEIKGAGFLLKHTAEEILVKDCMLSINDIEAITDLSFFPFLSNDNEEAIVKKINEPELWFSKSK